ncbi:MULTISPECIES: VOC family protein [unclassified Bosea (in: a-proteobacteria)]|uniref:VOC family protein n=1 Tax=unclassified Bosea (in: a-proteobacteria) TaxID=2653178 RepID=UPI000F75EFA6|nr:MULTISPECIES: VOC family protein [unclassified Bosea (in: a-proteobacteria)]AZO77174.1 glyoxalase [Bosea sp. Tri-49]RXT22025.1 glyoxalase [Bosea sp. Tri-39]RXT32366.1 glyoxalase [Bosea sp. Tri-54]
MSQPAEAIQTRAEPETRGGVVAYLSVEGAVKASEFYQKAFGAQEVARMPVDEKGRTMHIHLYVNGGSLMLSDPYPEHGYGWEKPQGFTLTLRVDDIDFWWKRGVEAGMEVVTPVDLMFWGDRYGQYRDPFGMLWALVSAAK